MSPVIQPSVASFECVLSGRKFLTFLQSESSIFVGLVSIETTEANLQLARYDETKKNDSVSKTSKPNVESRTDGNCLDDVIQVT